MIKKPSRLVSDCKCLPVSVHCQDRHLCHNRPTSRPQPRHHHIRQRRADDGRRFSPRRMIETARDAGLCRGRRVARGATCPTPRRAAHVVKVAMRRSDRPASKPMLSSPTCRSWRMVAAPNPARRMGRHRRFQASLRSVTPPPRHCGSGKIAGRRRGQWPRPLRRPATHSLTTAEAIFRPYTAAGRRCVPPPPKRAKRCCCLPRLGVQTGSRPARPGAPRVSPSPSRGELRRARAGSVKPVLLRCGLDLTSLDAPGYNRDRRN